MTNHCAVIALSALLMGCLAEESEVIASGKDEDAVIVGDSYHVPGDNALAQNALAQNALIANALTRNALAQNALAQNSLGAIASPDVVTALCDASTGDLARHFFKYMISCALTSAQKVTFSCGGSNYKYYGSLGLAPNWLTTAPTAADKQWTSACLASRVNAQGIHVRISMHSDTLDLEAGEQTDYPKQEGAFWGNLFNATPKLWSCRGAYYSARTSSGRSCTVNDCGIIKATGLRCEDHDHHPATPQACTTQVDEGSTFRVSGCSEPGQTVYNRAMTIYLQ